MKRVLIIGMTSTVGGVETFLTTLVENINFENLQIDFLTKEPLYGINMEKINAIIDNTPHLSSVERSFYKEMLHQRKTKILDFSMEKLKEKERSRKLCYKGLSR